MLEFNHEHIGIDLSQIRSKVSKAKNVGKVMLAGVAISAGLLLSGGCANAKDNLNVTSSAIIMENGNAMVVDIVDVHHYYSDGKAYVLTTASGDELVVDFASVKLITGEGSHEKAETIAQSLVGENGEVTCYDEVETFGKTR